MPALIRVSLTQATVLGQGITYTMITAAAMRINAMLDTRRRPFDFHFSKAAFVRLCLFRDREAGKILAHKRW